MKDIFKEYKVIFTALAIGVITMFIVSASLWLWSFTFGANLSTRLIGDCSAISSILAIFLKLIIDMSKAIYES